MHVIMLTHMPSYTHTYALLTTVNNTHVRMPGHTHRDFKNTLSYNYYVHNYDNLVIIIHNQELFQGQLCP